MDIWTPLKQIADRRRSEVAQQQERLFDRLDDEAEETARAGSIGNPVIEREGQLHDLAYGQSPS